MKTLSWAAVAVVALALVAGPSLANGIPIKPIPPPQPPVTQAPFNIAIDENAKEPVLYVSRQVMVNLRADAGEADPETQRTQAPSFHLIVAGTALAAALALGGLWFIRGRRKPGSTALLVLIAVALVVGTASVVWANVPPPRDPFPTPQKPVVPAGVPLAGKVRVEVVNEGEGMTLVCKKEHLAKILEEKPVAPKDPPKK